MNTTGTVQAGHVKAFFIKTICEGVKQLRGKFVVTLTGGIMLFFRFINRLLGFILFFTGLWVVGLAYILAVFSQAGGRFRNFDIQDLTSLIIVIGGAIIAIIIFLRNISKLFEAMPDNTLKRLIYSFSSKEYRPEREGDNIPIFMQSPCRDYCGFFFGQKIIEEFWGFSERVFFVSKRPGRDGHIVVVGGAGSGKSSCIAIPTLETWNGSIFAIDIKGELSAFYEKIDEPNKRPYIIFDPTNPNSKGFDPFYLLRKSETEGELVQYVRELALSIIPLPPNTDDPYWIETAQNILTGGILYFFYMGFGFSQTMDDILSNPVGALTNFQNQQGSQ